MAHENQRYRDTLFVSLFGRCINAKENFLSLYNAIHDTNLKIGEVEIKPMMLEQVFYNNLYNDVSMVIDGKVIVLAEQQSTINNNMPLRCLEYVARSFEKMYESKKKFREKLIELPAPEFYVFYNGDEDFPLEKDLFLSDAYKTISNNINLELQVKVININLTKNHDLLKKCKSLSDYSTFVSYARKAKKDGYKNYIDFAIERCLKENVMVEYLEHITSEERNMIFGEWDMEECIRIRAEERFEDGQEAKAKEATINAINKGLDFQTISDIVNLPLEQVQKLADELKNQ